MIPNRYTHQQFASMVGSNREAVTRAFRKLRDVGAVGITGRRVYVTDAHALERLANAER
jgi:CRP/FNR family cyclic AMP-dependent transcriptional regulator